LGDALSKGESGLEFRFGEFLTQFGQIVLRRV
jgi:hypothetical protein